jgi:hypothetical protein
VIARSSAVAKQNMKGTFTLLKTVFLLSLLSLPGLAWSQYTVTICQDNADAVIGPDRNDFVYTNPPVNEGYLHNFDPPVLPCPISNPSLTSLVVSIERTNITATPNCVGIPIYGNVLRNCGIGNICTIIEEVLTPGCGTFGAGDSNFPATTTLDLITCPNPIGINDVIGVDIIPSTDFGSCPPNTGAITDGTVAVTYQICLTYVYNQDVPADCTMTTTLPCDDGNPCTINDEEIVDFCDNSIICTACIGTPIDCSNSPTSVVACDDGDACTTNDMQTILDCDGSVCVPCMGVAVDCSSGTTSVVGCDDGNPCTINDMQTILDCDGSVCVPCMGTLVLDCSNTVALPCDDGDPCTENDEVIVESCDNSIVCIPCEGTPVALTCFDIVVLPCDDGDPCTENDEVVVEACDNSVVCVPCAGVAPSPCFNTVVLPCDDGDPCTEND